MDELRESSLLFSLERLHETERQRVEREARETQRKREEELVRVAEVAEQRRRVADEQRATALRLKALQVERERLEGERLQAMQRATIERARLEAEAAAQAQRADVEHAHRLKLTEIRERERAGRYRALSWLGGAGVVVSWGLALGGYWGVARPAHALREQHLQRLLDQSEQARKSRERELSQERKQVRELEIAFRDLESKRASVLAAPPQPPGGSRHPGVSSGSKRGTTAPPPCPDSGDPLQGCLGAGRLR